MDLMNPDPEPVVREPRVPYPIGAPGQVSRQIWALFELDVFNFLASVLGKGRMFLYLQSRYERNPRVTLPAIWVAASVVGSWLILVSHDLVRHSLGLENRLKTRFTFVDIKRLLVGQPVAVGDEEADAARQRSPPDMQDQDVDQ